VKPLDERARRDHPYLSTDDQCWYLTEYVGNEGCGFAGAASRLILQLKAAPSSLVFNPGRARRKRQAARQLAALLRAVVTRDWVEGATWIPIPPSQAPGDVEHDNRLMPVLRMAFADYDADIRTLLYQCESTPPDHRQRRRQTARKLYDRLQINWHVVAARPLRDRLVLFDDVVTTGKHYHCCEQRLHAALPGISVSGFFMARRLLSGRACRPP
jgi:predicted amidophosphoribosyltransferase